MKRDMSLVREILLEGYCFFRDGKGSGSGYCEDFTPERFGLVCESILTTIGILDTTNVSM